MMEFRAAAEWALKAAVTVLAVAVPSIALARAIDGRNPFTGRRPNRSKVEPFKNIKPFKFE